MKICTFLRWKGSHLRQNALAVQRVVDKNSVPYSCLKTMQIWSPTGDIVAPECCNEQRSCYKAKVLPSGQALTQRSSGLDTTKTSNQQS